jgi:phenylalanyl-tRNA synthetase beta subunit
VLFRSDFSAVEKLPCEKKSAKEVSKFPKTKLDFTFIWDGVFAELDEKFDKLKYPLIMGRKLKDIYENRYTLTFTVGSYEKTLTAEEIGAVHKKIIDFAVSNGVLLHIGEREHFLH